MARRLLFASLIFTAACVSSDEPGGDCSTGKCDDPATFACKNVAAAADLHDPIAELIIKAGDSCPTNFQEVMAKLDVVDDKDCVGEKNGVRTTLVSDQARLLGQPERYRTVTTRTCGGRPDHGIVFTLLNVTPASKSSEFSFIEMMAFDPTTGLFNYYTQSSGNWSFVANSMTVADGGAGCSSCHNAGGLIMKELDFPWVHWDSSEQLPGADQVFASMPELGVRTSAAGFEKVVKSGNQAFSETRQRLLADQAAGVVSKLIRPVFCQSELNLDTAGEQLGAGLSTIPADFFLDPELVATGEIQMDDATYEAAITAANQRMPGLSSHRDTEFKFVYPKRAHVDVNYVASLRKGNLLDEDFVRDVLAIDFTRPLFSAARCDLLKYAPRLAAEQATGAATGAPTNTAIITQVTPDAIRQGFLENLNAAMPRAGSPEEKLRAHLLAAGDSNTHVAAAEGFLAACAARPAAQLMTDLMMVVTSLRQTTKGKSIIENPVQMPDTDLAPGPNTHLDPVTCKLAGN